MAQIHVVADLINPQSACRAVGLFFVLGAGLLSPFSGRGNAHDKNNHHRCGSHRDCRGNMVLPGDARLHRGRHDRRDCARGHLGRDAAGLKQ